MPQVSVVIPTLNAEREIGAQLDRVLEQNIKPFEILVIDSSSTDRTASIVNEYSNFGVRLVEIERREFDHGGTRAYGAEIAQGDVLVYLTQDAYPANEKMLEQLIMPLRNPRIGMSYGRQLPRVGAKCYEALTREFNYPSKSHIRSSSDIHEMGIKAFFCSDSCAAYRKDAYIRCGGFERPCSTNEDMFMAAKMLYAGYSIAYTASAEVLHSHNLTFIQQFKRSKASAVEMARHKSLLGNTPVVSEGARMVTYVFSGLMKRRKYSEIPKFVSDCLARVMGSCAARGAIERQVSK